MEKSFNENGVAFLLNDMTLSFCGRRFSYLSCYSVNELSFPSFCFMLKLCMALTDCHKSLSQYLGVSAWIV